MPLIVAYVTPVTLLDEQYKNRPRRKCALPPNRKNKLMASRYVNNTQRIQVLRHGNGYFAGTRNTHRHACLEMKLIRSTHSACITKHPVKSEVVSQLTDT
jgi:hypothetical protein